jgi:hypothetical protein
MSRTLVRLFLIVVDGVLALRHATGPVVPDK